MRNKILLTLILSLIFCNLFSQVYFEDEVIYIEGKYKMYIKNTMTPVNGCVIQSLNPLMYSHYIDGLLDGIKATYSDNGDLIKLLKYKRFYDPNSDNSTATHIVESYEWNLDRELIYSHFSMPPSKWFYIGVTKYWHNNGVLKEEILHCCNYWYEDSHTKSHRKYSNEGEEIINLPYKNGNAYLNGSAIECDAFEEYFVEYNLVSDTMSNYLKNTLYTADSIRDFINR